MTTALRSNEEKKVTYETTMEGRPQLGRKRERKRDRSDGSWTGRRKITWQSKDDELKKQQKMGTCRHKRS